MQYCVGSTNLLSKTMLVVLCWFNKPTEQDHARSHGRHSEAVTPRSSSRQNRNAQNISETTFNYQSCIDFSYAPVIEKRNPETVERSSVRRKFSWRGFIQWHMVVISICVVTIWRHVHVSKPKFRRCFLRHYIMYCIFFYTHYPVLSVIALNIYYQRSKFGYWRKIHSTLRHTSP